MAASQRGSSKKEDQRTAPQGRWLGEVQQSFSSWLDYDRTGGFGNQSGIVDRINMIDHRENAPGSDQVRDKIRKPSP